MRAPRALRLRVAAKATRSTASSTEPPKDLPATFYATSGSATVERAPARRFEHGEHNPLHDMPIIIGFRPNGERA